MLSQKVKPVTFALDEGITDVTVLADKSVLFCCEPYDKVEKRIHILNTQKKQAKDPIVLTKALFPCNYSQQSCCIAMPSGGFVTLLRNSLYIWKKENDIKEEPILSKDGSPINIFFIENIFFQNYHHVGFFVNVWTNINLNFDERAVIFVNLNTLQISFHSLKLATVSSPEKKNAQTLAPTGIIFDWLHVFSDGQFIGHTSFQSYNVDYRCILWSGYIENNGKMHLLKKIDDGGYICKAVSSDGQFVAIESGGPVSGYKLNIYQSQNALNWKLVNRYKSNYSLLQLNFIEENRLIFTFATEEGRRLEIFNINPNKECEEKMLDSIPLLPIGSVIERQHTTQYFSNDYALRVKKNSKGDKIYLSQYYLHQENKNNIEKEIINVGIDRNLAPLIWEYSREFLFFKPFYPSNRKNALTNRNESQADIPEESLQSKCIIS